MILCQRDQTRMSDFGATMTLWLRLMRVELHRVTIRPPQSLPRRLEAHHERVMERNELSEMVSLDSGGEAPPGESSRDQ
jgi:hypothetical protein